MKSNFKMHTQKLMLTTVCIALMAVVASVSGLNVAQQKLAIEFRITQSTVIWIINIYTISLASLLLPFGALGDKIGRKPTLIIGLIIFGISSILSGVAPSSSMMMAARFLSGVGAALIMPVTLAIITTNFPDEERSKAIGVWTAVAGGGGILGMFLSAVLVDFMSWRWLFLLPVILAVIAVIMTLLYIPDSKNRSEHKFDFTGSLLSVFAIMGFVFALHEFPERGWMDFWTITSFVTGIIGSFTFIIWELRHPSPILNVRLFKKKSLLSGSISLIFLFGVQAGIFVVLFPYFQAVLGWTGIKSTFAMMPMAVLMMLASGMAPKIKNYLSIRALMASGILVSGIGAALMSGFASIEGGYLSILPGMLIMGLGMGLTMTPATESITSSLSADQQGVASALNDITREIGTALGVALLGAVATVGYSQRITPQLQHYPDSVIKAAESGIAGALYIAPNTGSQAGILISIAQESFLYGWKTSMWSGTVILAFLFLYLLILGPKNKI